MKNDVYTDFCFNEKFSTDMKVVITNSRDLSLSFGPAFTDTTTSLGGGDGYVLEQTAVTATKLTMKCVAVDVTLNEWRKICKWLSPDTIGRLQFNFNNQSFYMVKLSAIPTPVMEPYRTGTYIITFSLSFTTIGEPYAIYPTVSAYLNGDEEFAAIAENTSVAPYYFPLTTYVGAEAGGTTISSTYVNGSNKEFSITYTGTGLSSIDIGNVVEISVVDGETVLSNYDLIITIDEDDLTTSAYTLGDGDIFIQNLEFESLNGVFTSLTFDLVITNNSAFVKSSETAGVTFTSKAKDGFNAVFNTGEIDARPQIAVDCHDGINSYTIAYNDAENIVTSLSFLFSIADSYLVTIDYKTNIATINGALLGSAGDSSGISLLDAAGDNYINDLVIPSGDVEITYGEIIDKENIEIATGDGTLGIFYRYTIELRNDLMSVNRAENEYGIHIFDINDEIGYNISTYGSIENYDTVSKTVANSVLLLDPTLIFDEDDDYKIYIITNEDSLVLNSSHYFSICNYEKIIATSEGGTADYQLVLTPRGVI